MKQKKTLFIIVLIFVLLLGGAYVLYTQLGDSLAPNQLAVQEPQQDEIADANEPADTDEDADTDETTDAEETAGTEETVPPKPIAPDFTVYDAEGNEVHLSDFIGKPIVLNFWASWCGPCQMEMPDFHEKYLELGENINFLMINMTNGRETLESATAFIQEHEYTFPVFYDTQFDAAMTYGAYSLPTTFFIDAEGYAIAQATGAIDAATLQRGIDMIIP